MTTKPNSYLTDRVDIFTREFLGIEHFAELEAFLTETIQQSMEVGREKGRKQVFELAKGLILEPNGLQKQIEEFEKLLKLISQKP